MTELAEALSERASDRADVAAKLYLAVDEAYRHLSLPATQSGRLSTAKACADLTESLRRAPDRLSRIRALAQAQLPGTEAAAAKSLSQASRVAAALDEFRWERLSPLRTAADRGDERGRAAKAILDRLAKAVVADEFAEALPPVLERTDQAIFDWLAAGQPDRSGPESRHQAENFAEVAGSAPETGRAVRRPGQRADGVLSELRSFLDSHTDRDVVVEWRIKE